MLVVSEPQTVVVEEEEDNENVIKIKVQSTDHRNNVREYKVMKVRLNHVILWGAVPFFVLPINFCYLVYGSLSLCLPFLYLLV